VIAVHLIQDMTLMLAHVAHGVDSISLFHGHLPDSPLLAQMVRQTDLVGDIQRWFDTVVKTGQGWAFLIGLVAGYMVKTFTTFG
jgi:hypothetical protein